MAAPTIINVSSVSPDGVYVTGDIISIQVQFSEAVTISDPSHAGVSLALSATISAHASYDHKASDNGNGTDTITLKHTVGAGEATNDLDYVGTNSLVITLVPPGTIQSVSTNQDADLTLPTPGGSGSLSYNSAIRIHGRTDTYRPLAAARAVRDFLRTQDVAVTMSIEAAALPRLIQKNLTDMEVRVTPRRRTGETLSRRDSRDIIGLSIEMTEPIPDTIKPVLDIDSWSADDIAWWQRRMSVVDQFFDVLKDGTSVGAFTIIGHPQNEPIYDEGILASNRLFASVIQVTVRAIVLR